MPKKNIELLKRLRTRFLRMRHREHFNMAPIARKTDCGAAMCLIGHTLDLAGYKMRFNAGNSSMYGSGFIDFDFYSPAGRKVDPSDLESRAAKLLGLSPGTANRLFQDYSLTTPKHAAERITKLINA